MGSSGPFSIFPNIDRTLLILDGIGMSVSVDDDESISIRDQPFCFRGESTVVATLLDGPVTDLNVMTRRGVFSQSVSRILLTTSRDLVVTASVTLIYNHQGTLRAERLPECQRDGNPEESAECNGPMSVAAGETLYVEQSPVTLRLSVEGPCLLFVIELCGPLQPAESVDEAADDLVEATLGCE